MALMNCCCGACSHCWIGEDDPEDVVFEADVSGYSDYIGGGIGIIKGWDATLLNGIWTLEWYATTASGDCFEYEYRATKTLTDDITNVFNLCQSTSIDAVYRLTLRTSKSGDYAFISTSLELPAFFTVLQALNDIVGRRIPCDTDGGWSGASGSGFDTDVDWDATGQVLTIEDTYDATPSLGAITIYSVRDGVTCQLSSPVGGTATSVITKA